MKSEKQNLLRDYPIVASEGLCLQSSEEDYVLGIEFKVYII